VLDMQQADVAARAKELSIRSVPAVVVDGKLADCCAGRGTDEVSLRAAGIGAGSPKGMSAGGVLFASLNLANVAMSQGRYDEARSISRPA